MNAPLGALEQTLVVAPQRRVALGAIGTGCLVFVLAPLPDIARYGVAALGAITVCAMGVAALAGMFRWHRAHPTRVWLHERGIAFLRHGVMESHLTGGLLVTRERRYLDLLSFNAVATHWQVDIAGHAPLLLTQTSANADAVTRLISRLPRADAVVPSADLALLRQRMARSALKSAAGSAGMVLLAGLAAWVSVRRTTHTLDDVVPPVLAVMFMGAAWMLSSEARLMFPVERSLLYRAITLGQRSILWAHVSESGGSHGVVVHFDDGRTAQVDGTVDECDRILALVGARIPDVIIGFGGAEAEAYRLRRVP